MSVFKEAMFMTKELRKLQVPIYDDSADYGIPIWSFEDTSVQTCKSLIDMYFCEETDKREVSRYSTGSSVKVTMKMIEEWQSKEAFNVVVEYVTTRGTRLPERHKGIIGYIQIYSDNWKW